MSEAAIYVHKEVLFQFKGDHPHVGEFAHPCGKTPESMTRIEVGSEFMFLMHLVNCSHGTDRCYATKAQMRLVMRP